MESATDTTDSATTQNMAFGRRMLPGLRAIAAIRAVVTAPGTEREPMRLRATVDIEAVAMVLVTERDPPRLKPSLRPISYYDMVSKSKCPNVN